MFNFARTALLIEEKAARLARDDPQRAHLLMFAGAARLLSFEQASYTFEMHMRIGLHRKRACVLSRLAEKMPDGPDRWHIERKALRAALAAALERV